MWRQRWRSQALCASIPTWPKETVAVEEDAEEEAEEDAIVDYEEDMDVGSDEESVAWQGSPAQESACSPAPPLGSFGFLRALALRVVGEPAEDDGCGRSESEHDAGDHGRVVLGRYRYRFEDVMGQGGFSTVFRGEDVVTGEPIAVKVLSQGEPHSPSSTGSSPLAQFQTEVRMLQALQQAPCPHAGTRTTSFAVSDEASREIVDRELPPHHDLFVGLLDFSRCGDPVSSSSNSGLEAQPMNAEFREKLAPGAALDGQYYLILEKADETMQVLLSSMRVCTGTRRLEDVRRLFLQLCQVVTGLHLHGLVHLDLKPANVMRFPSGRFKLIDLDGVQPCGCTLPITEIVSTAKYCAPEVADAVLRVDDDAEVKISRLMDVFSLGLIGVELACGVHPLEDVWARHMCGESADEDAYLRCVADLQAEVAIPFAVRSMSAELDDLLRTMLRKEGRASMPEVMAHPFWQTRATSTPPCALALAGFAAGRPVASQLRRQGGA